MENKDLPDLEFDGEKLSYLLENASKLHMFLSKEQIDSLVLSLKTNLSKIEETIEILKDQNKEEE